MRAGRAHPLGDGGAERLGIAQCRHQPVREALGRDDVVLVGVGVQRLPHGMVEDAVEPALRAVRVARQPDRHGGVVLAPQPALLGRGVEIRGPRAQGGEALAPGVQLGRGAVGEPRGERARTARRSRSRTAARRHPGRAGDRARARGRRPCAPAARAGARGSRRRGRAACRGRRASRSRPRAPTSRGRRARWCRRAARGRAARASPGPPRPGGGCRRSSSRRAASSRAQRRTYTSSPVVSANPRRS